MKRFSRSSIEVASAGIISQLHFSAKSLISPILIAIGALVRTNSAPCFLASSATFHAIDLESNAPKIIPFLPFNNILVFLVLTNINEFND